MRLIANDFPTESNVFRRLMNDSLSTRHCPQVSNAINPETFLATSSVGQPVDIAGGLPRFRDRRGDPRGERVTHSQN
jgi:hypothetical protein